MSSTAGLEAAVAGRTLAIKLGGSVGEDDTLPEDVVELQQAGARIVIVHGGGPLITSWLARTGSETRFVKGLRYTDANTLEVVRMVLAGLVNGEIVARIGRAGGRAVGLSGADDSLIRARMRDAELGRVGEVSAVNARPIELLLEAGYIVVLAPLALDEEGEFLNVNADTVAGGVAAALGCDRLIFLTDVPGLVDGDRLVSQLTTEETQLLIDRGVVTGGFLPKVEACVRAARGHRLAQIVDGRVPHVVLRALAEPGAVGTTIME